jgi:hypothetical protein
MSDKLDGSSLVDNSVTETQLDTAFTNKVTNAYTVANLAYTQANSVLSATSNTTITGNVFFAVGSKLGLGTLTPATTFHVNGTMMVADTIEEINVSATAMGANINFDVLNQPILYLTSNATANSTINFRGNSTSTFENYMSTGNSVTLSLLVTNGSTAYTANTVQIDSVVQTVKWAGGAAPTFGNANSIDLYSFTLIKTAPVTYTILASQQRYS